MSATMTNGERVAARVAAADQQHLMVKVAASLGSQASMTTTAAHPWLAGLGERMLTLLTTRGGARVCPHVGPGLPIGPMHAEFVGNAAVITCRGCLAFRPPLGPVDDRTCDRCSVYTRRGLVMGVLPIGPMLLSFGVCGRCAGELGVAP
ncbi:hypothetical protein [Micromonospora ureilytica]|uniref:Formate dehydrogenase accessory protein FdhE n=1 Tax=Micromonospora ureilytica TaxID=709868 RepID=A0ABS0JSP7_9ACTN|nr:hypothetical protein [Micromonospora ureilytica]MBG6070069.1 hypothetical protein [Micromonospora ureilytica]